MVSSRIGIAAQAIGVAALATIVYFAFLQPNDSDPLQSIDVDDGLEVEAAPGPARRHRQGRAPRKRGGTVPAQLAPSGPALPAPPEPPATIPAADTPADSQYETVVARILARVARARR